MDLSNLSKTLPPSNRVKKDSIKIKNKEILDEFKNGAKSITKLFQLSKSMGELYINQGYLNCINDLLELMNDLNNGNNDEYGEENKEMKLITEFLMNKKHELFDDNSVSNSGSEEVEEEEQLQQQSSTANLTNKFGMSLNNTNNNNNNESNKPINDLDDLKDYEFSLSHEKQKKFYKSRPPLSMDYSSLKTRNHYHGHGHHLHHLNVVKEKEREKEKDNDKEMDDSSNEDTKLKVEEFELKDDHYNLHNRYKRRK